VGESALDVIGIVHAMDAEALVRDGEGRPCYVTKRLAVDTFRINYLDGSEAEVRLAFGDNLWAERP